MRFPAILRSAATNHCLAKSNQCFDYVRKLVLFPSMSASLSDNLSGLDQELVNLLLDRQNDVLGREQTEFEVVPEREPVVSDPAAVPSHSESSQHVDDVDPCDDEEGIRQLTQGEINQRSRDFIVSTSSRSQTTANESDGPENADIIDPLDEATARRIMEVGCGCNRKCYQRLDFDRVHGYRLDLAEFSRQEKDILLLAKLQSMEMSGDTARGEKRSCQRFRYTFDGEEICEKAFRFVHFVGPQSFKNLKAHYKDKGVVPRVHGLKGKKAHNAYSFEVIADVIKFLEQYAQENGIPMPAAPRGRDGVPPVYLPSSVRKEDIYKQYVDSCKACSPSKQCVGLTTFKGVWSSCAPHIQKMNIRTDVCSKCEKFRQKIMYAVSEEEKLTLTSEYNDHVCCAKARREFYNECVSKSSVEVSAASDVEIGSEPCSNDLFDVHYTFDFAQSFLLPHQTRQVSPLYFLSPLKVHCFGVCNEALKFQINYLFDEADSISVDGKKSHGPNNVISMLDHFFSHYSLGEMECKLHADNCGGQNKNKSIIHYFCYRCAKGLHEEISLHFMEPGHTKCICDACFGKMRQLYRRSDVDLPDQLGDLVNASARVNKVQMHSNSATCEEIVQWYSWDSYLSSFMRPLKGIRKYHHFRFVKADAGAVYVKKVSMMRKKESVCSSLVNHGLHLMIVSLIDYQQQV
ncbi:uncharacterized protein [Ptychodera flava]|uniref:uncharacterized protein n=1 Tax=Ptychodera flava TaxID=63121 RepID=UPI00396A7D22